MSLPPGTVHIKRKATDEPVDFLRVHESNGKRQRKTEFVFSRQVPSINDSAASSPAGAPPGIRRIKQITRSVSSQALGTRTLTSQTQAQDAGSLGVTTKESPEDGQPTPLANTIPQSTPSSAAPTTPQSLKPQPRRFHISRSASSTSPTRSVLSGRVQKPATLFVERKTRPKLSPAGSSSPVTPALTPEPAQAPAQKKPGRAARTSTAPSSNTSTSRPAPQLAPEPRNVRLPSGLIAPWSLNDQQLVEEMQAYTLQEIGHSIAVAEAAKPERSPAPPSSLQKPSRFKPKIPKLRYHERHPEQVINQDNDAMDIEDFDEDMNDDSEYIIDTYVRMVADDMDVDADKNFGFLVLDGQSDIDEFYSGEVSSDEDEDYDEEDENAENHYTADYPDDEVASDDEFGHNPYQYQYANNDIDDDGTFSDDGDDSDGEGGMKYPWNKNKRPAWLRGAHRAFGVDHEDGEDEHGDGMIEDD